MLKFEQKDTRFVHEDEIDMKQPKVEKSEFSKWDYKMAS